MKKLPVVLSSLTAAALLSGCATEETNFNLVSTDEQKQAVHNGKKTPTLYSDLTTEQQNAVVSIFSTFYDDDDYYDNYGFCTGTVISPHVILTAAHCLTSLDENDYGGYEETNFTKDDIVIHTGFDNTNPIGSYELQAAIFKTDENGKNYWQAKNNGYENYLIDVAVLILKEPIPNVTPIPLHNGRIDDLFLKTAQAVGYGIADENHDGEYNTKRWWTNQTMIGYQSGMIGVDGSALTGVDSGDSGSPLLYDSGKGVEVIGNLSNGTDDFFDMYTPAYYNEAWIRSYINKYDTPDCEAVCQNVECGEVDGCACDSCAENYQCKNNTCELVIGGQGGSCYNAETDKADSCESHDDCLNGEKCVAESGSSTKHCRPTCAVTACSASDAESYCLPVNAIDGDYLSMCATTKATKCGRSANYFDPCTTADNTVGRCLPDITTINSMDDSYYYDGDYYCYGYCQAATGCTSMEVCKADEVEISCSEVCTGKSCGVVAGCTCGTCGANEECTEQYQCVGQEIEPTPEDDGDNEQAEEKTAAEENQGSSSSSDNGTSAKKGCNSVGDTSLLAGLLLAAGLWLARRRHEAC